MKSAVLSLVLVAAFAGSAYAFNPEVDAVWPPSYKRVSYQGTNHAEGYARILLEEKMTREWAIAILEEMSEVANATVQRGIEDGTNAGVPTCGDFDIIAYQDGDLRASAPVSVERRR